MTPYIATARSSESGFAMVLVMFVVLIVSGLSMGLLQEGMASRRALENHKSNLRALEIAEAGLVRAEMELRSQVDLDGDGGVGSASGTYADGIFAVAVTNDPVSTDRWTLHAAGEHAHSRRRIEVGVRRRTGRSYAEALFSMDDLPLSSVDTDAYDSDLGTYAAQAVNVDANGPYALTGGSVGSNGDIVLDGTTVWVRGNTIPGLDQEVQVSGNPTVTGDMVPRTFQLALDPEPQAVFEAAMNNNSNNTGISHDGNGNAVRYNGANYTLDVTGTTNVTMAGGTYFFRTMKFGGGSTLTITGPVDIYITEKMDIGSGTHIIANRPGDVRLHVHPYALPSGGAAPTQALVKINGGSNITWTMYGPATVLDIGGGNSFYGAAIGKRVELQGNNAFHYDLALGRNLGTEVALLERLYWREISPPRR